MSKAWHFLGNLKTHTWLRVVAASAVVMRVALYLTYRPVTYNDTGSYRRLAGQVLAGWDTYDGTRLPGYPVFMAWVGPDERVYAVQLILGVLITLLFFYIGWRISRQGWFAALAAFAYTLNPQQVLVEADLMSETLTIFLLVLSLAGMAWLLTSEGERPLWQAVLAGVGIGAAAGLTVMVRTLFVFLPFLAALALLVFRPRAPSRNRDYLAGTGTTTPRAGTGTTSRARLRVRVAGALAIGLAGLALIGLWVNFIHERFGTWSMDTLTGYHLMNHAGLFFEDVPDEYADIRDTFIRYRDAQTAETGHPGNAIWDAIPELVQVSGVGFIPLSSLLAKISLRLILQHPGQYLFSVGEGWLAFWKVPVHWALASPDPSPLVAARRGIILLIRGGLFLANLAFIGGTLALIWKKARRALGMDAFLGLLVGTTWAASILQAFVEYGDNPRYSIPVQTLVLLVVLWWGTSILTRKKYENVVA